MLKLDKVIVVEGKYDKIKLSSIIDGIIIVTNGFGIFKDKEKLELIRMYAREKGIVILTDSDSAGFKIRGYLKGSVANDRITNVYIPDIFGKEKRKEKPSSEGKLGVEGIDAELITEAFRKAGITFSENDEPLLKEPVTRADLFELGLTGTGNSSKKRQRLLKKLGLPEKLSTTGMLEAINVMFSRDEIMKLMDDENEEDIEA